MTDVFSNLVKGQGDKGEKYCKNNVWHQFALRKKKRKDEEANIQKNKMIKKNTTKVIFGKKKESDHFCLCNPGIMGFGILFSAPEGNQESVTVTINKNPESKFH